MKKFLIVGLGNIGTEYEETRHNIGFKIVDTLNTDLAGSYEEVKHGSLSKVRYKGRELYLLNPNTYMNLIGKAVSYWMQQEKIGLDGLLIVTDDLNLPFGTLRIKAKGSDGGHNGLKDIQTRLGTTNYPRFRFGIGADFSKGQQVDYVLGSWDSAEEEQLGERLAKASEAIKTFSFNGLEATMNTYNNT